jgi:hypothetical protein
MPTFVLRYRLADRDAVRVMLREVMPWVSWPPWGEQTSGNWWEIHSTRADTMRRAYRATHPKIVAVWDGRRWLRPMKGRWVTFPSPPPSASKSP